MIGIRSATIAAALLAAFAGTAFAQGLFDSGQWYGKAFGGATWPSGEDTNVRIGGVTVAQPKLDFDTGYVLGAALGYDYTSNFALELEYAYRNAGASGDFSGDASSNAFMLNALYKFNPMGASGQIQPYIGGGLGVANLDVHEDNLGSFKTNGDFAYQAIAGVSYQFNPSWSLLGEVRWFAIDTSRLDGPQNTSLDTDFSTFDLLVGASYRF